MEMSKIGFCFELPPFHVGFPPSHPGGQAIRKSMRLTADAMKLAEESGFSPAVWAVLAVFFVWKKPDPL